MSIESLDFIFSIKVDDTPLESRLRAVVETLQQGGFHTQARPGHGLVLVFAKLSAAKYAQLAKEDQLKSYEFGVTAKDDTPADRPRVIYAYLTSPKDVDGLGITPGKGDWPFVTSITPVSGYLADKSLFKRAKDALAQPVLDTTQLNKLYGSDVALYFEFVKFYAGALGVLSIFGTIAYLRSKAFSLTFSFVNLIWGVLFLILWKRRERYLVNFWGVQNVHKVDVYDADLAVLNSGVKRPSSYKDRDHSEGLKFVKQLAFAPIALAFVAVLVSYQLACFVLEIFLSEIYDGPGKMFLTLLPTVAISVFVPVLTIVYNIVVDKFLVWEQHDNSYTRYDSFVVKTFVLNFLTGYVPLLITAFIYLPFAHLVAPNLPNIQNAIASNISENRYVYKYLTKVKSQQEFQINQDRLNAQFFYFVVTNQVIQVVLKYVLPLVLAPVMELVNTKVLGKEPATIPEDAPEEKSWLARVRDTVNLPEPNVNDDYRGLTLQYGYLVLFGPVWTLAPLVSLVFTVLTFKLDTLRLTSGKYFRPPVPKRVDSIHPWDHAFFLLTWIGSVVSPIVTSFYRHGTKPPKTLGQLALDKASVNVSSSLRLVLTFFVSEHLFFILYFVGTKVSNFLRSKPEVDNNFVDNDIKLRRDHFSEHAKQTSEKAVAHDDDEWQSSSVESILKQAKGFDKPADASKLPSAGKLSSVGKLTAVGGAAGATAGTLSNRAELEEKRRQLQEQKEQLRLRKDLEAHKEKGDSVIQTVGSDGKPTLAIIDNNDHIPMEDVKKVELDLSGKDKVSKEEEKTTPEEDDESEEASESVSDVADSTAGDSTKKSKKKGLKKLLKKF